MLFSHHLYQEGLVLTDQASRSTDVYVISPDMPLNRAAALAANAQAQRMVYSNMYVVGPDPAPANVDSYPIDWATANANEAWFLHSTAAGNPRLTNGGLFYMDVGNAAFRAAAIAFIISRYDATGPWDGVFLDIVDLWQAANGACVEYADGLGSIATWPNDWQSALLGWIGALCGALHAHGVPVIVGNVDQPQAILDVDGVSKPVKDLCAQGLDGIMAEAFGDGGLGAAQNAPFVTELIATVDWSYKNGKWLMANNYDTGPDRQQSYRYSLGLLLMGANPADPANKLVLKIVQSGAQGPVAWYPEYDTATQLGRPQQNYIDNGDGTYQRAFAKGAVVVNTTGGVLRGVPAYDATIELYVRGPGRPLTPLGLAMLAQLPPVLRNSDDYQAVIHPYAREIELLEASIETVRAQFNPATADVLLPAWEAELRLPVGGAPGATIADRRSSVLARLQKRLSGSGADWEAAITAIVGSGWSYVEHEEVPEKNYVPEPDFSHVAVGAAPAVWSIVGTGYAGSATSMLVDAQGWADITVPAGASPGASIPIGTILNGETVTATVEVKAGKAGQTVQVGLEDDWNGNGGQTHQAVLVNSGDTTRVSVTWTPTADSAHARLYVSVIGAAAGDVFSIRQSIVGDGANPPVWGSGDSTNWVWDGVVGQSSSHLVTPAAGIVEVTLPYPPGSSQFVEASNAIAEITDAHLELSFGSSAVFQLDTSPMDSTEFGA